MPNKLLVSSSARPPYTTSVTYLQEGLGHHSIAHRPRPSSPEALPSSVPRSPQTMRLHPFKSSHGTAQCGRWGIHSKNILGLYRVLEGLKHFQQRSTGVEYYRFPMLINARPCAEAISPSCWESIGVDRKHKENKLSFACSRSRDKQPWSSLREFPVTQHCRN